MNFDRLVEQVISGHTVGVGASLQAFRCELTLCATIVAMLLAKVVFPRWKNSAFVFTLLGLGVAIVAAFPLNWIPSYPWSWVPEWLLSVLPAHSEPAGSIFSGALAADSFTTFLRVLLLLFTVLFTTFIQMAGAFDQEDLTEFHTLMLGALVGMCLMISANHVLIVLLGVEMASVPCYVLAGMQRHRSRAGEAALKYSVFGAGTAGVMLFGLSLLAGVLGSAHLPTMSVRLAELLQSRHLGASNAVVLSLGGLMLMVGVAFKLSAVPFHFWAPDVFEGATAEVAAFLSVASKAAALGLLMRLAATFAFPVDHSFGACRPSARRAPCSTRLRRAAVYHHHSLGAGRRHLHFRQPGRLRAVEHEAAAGLFHHRPCRLHDDAHRRGRRPGGLARRPARRPSQRRRRTRSPH